MGAAAFGVLSVLEHRHDLSAVVLPMAHAPFVLAIVFLSVVASVLSYLALNRALEVLPVARTAALINSLDRCVRARRGAPPARAVRLGQRRCLGRHPRRHLGRAALRCAGSAGYRRERRTAVPVVNGPAFAPLPV
ncbi:MAG: hypothetical protein ACLUNO_10265 [Oscillospiraceae bacterium]